MMLYDIRLLEIPFMQDIHLRYKQAIQKKKERSQHGANSHHEYMLKRSYKKIALKLSDECINQNKVLERVGIMLSPIIMIPLLQVVI